MFILNKTNNTIQECHNADAIKCFAKDPKRYQVAKTKEELTGAEVKAVETKEEDAVVDTQIEAQSPESESGEEITEQNQENDSEGTTEAQGQESEAAAVDYSAMKVEDLRKVAKEKGIQGYANMNKGTLVEVIKAHE